MIKTWHPGMTDKETADLAYWERNMLALRYADGWYNDDIPEFTGVSMTTRGMEMDGFYKPRYQGWRRVLSLDGGRITFHIADDFEVGSLQKMTPNWDGHTTEQKWDRIQKLFSIYPPPSL